MPWDDSAARAAWELNPGNSKKRAVPNDRELLDCLARGWTTSEIAEEYHVGEHGLSTQFFRVRKRMGAKTAAQAIYLYATRPSFDERGYWNKNA